MERLEASMIPGNAVNFGNVQGAALELKVHIEGGGAVDDGTGKLWNGQDDVLLVGGLVGEIGFATNNRLILVIGFGLFWLDVGTVFGLTA